MYYFGIEDFLCVWSENAKMKWLRKSSKKCNVWNTGNIINLIILIMLHDVILCRLNFNACKYMCCLVLVSQFATLIVLSIVLTMDRLEICAVINTFFCLKGNEQRRISSISYFFFQIWSPYSYTLIFTPYTLILCISLWIIVNLNDIHSVL